MVSSDAPNNATPLAAATNQNSNEPNEDMLRNKPSIPHNEQRRICTNELPREKLGSNKINPPTPNTLAVPNLA